MLFVSFILLILVTAVIYQDDVVILRSDDSAIGIEESFYMKTGWLKGEIINTVEGG